MAKALSPKEKEKKDKLDNERIAAIESNKFWKGLPTKAGEKFKISHHTFRRAFRKIALQKAAKEAEKD